MIFKFFTWLRHIRVQRSLKKAITQVKERKSFSYKSVEEWEAKRQEWKQMHPFQHWFKQTIYYPIYRIPSKIEDFFLNIKWFIQRGKRGYADCDIWQFDTYLAKIIFEGTRIIKDIKHGVPMLYFKSSDRGYKDGNFSEKVMEIADKRYDYVLDEIAWTMAQYHRCQYDGNLMIPNDGKYYNQKMLKKMLKFCDTMNKKHNTEYTVISQKDYKRYLNGWYLLTHYFPTLND